MIARREEAIFGHVDSQGIKHEGLLDALASASSGDQKSIAEELRSIEEELNELSIDIEWDAQRMDRLFPDGKVMRTQPGEKDQLLLNYEQSAEIELNRIEALIFKFILAIIEVAPRRCLCEVECDADVYHDDIMAQPYVLFEQQPVFEKEEVESSEMFLEPQKSQSEIEMAYVLPAIRQSMDDDVMESSRNDSGEAESSVLTEEE